MNKAAEVRPLARTKPAIDGNKQAHRGVEKLVTALDLCEPAGAVFPGSAERTIKFQSVLKTSAAIGLPHLGRQRRILGLHGPPVLFLDRVGSLALDFPKRLTGHRM